MKIALSTDHAGFESLQKVQEFLEALGHECVNYGPREYDPADDYPDFIKQAGQAVSHGECDAGIVYGSSGQGEAMICNRLKGVRCAVYYGIARPLSVIDADGTMPKDDYEILRLSRQHNHANMLSLAGRFLSQDEVEKAVTIWLETPYSDIERHVRRVAKIDQQ